VWRRPAWIDDLFLRFKETRIEDWSDERWEAFTMSALWEVCREGVRLAGERTPTTKPLIRHRDLLGALGGMDSDLLVNDVLIRFCSAFLDQGIAHWALPERDAGFFTSFCALHAQGNASSAWWMSGLKDEVTRLQTEGVTALASIEESLTALGVKADEVEDFLSATLSGSARLGRHDLACGAARRPRASRRAGGHADRLFGCAAAVGAFCAQSRCRGLHRLRGHFGRNA
jgi:hypothetical protein